jgi:hypothetical protein
METVESSAADWKRRILEFFLLSRSEETFLDNLTQKKFQALFRSFLIKEQFHLVAS